MPDIKGDQIVNNFLHTDTLDQSKMWEWEEALLVEFFSGYPVEKLGMLLESKSTEIVEVGASLLSELGVKAEPLLKQHNDLLAHSSWKVRYDVIESILACSLLLEISFHLEVISLCEDHHVSVQRKVMNYLSKLNQEVLENTLEALIKDSASKSHIEGVAIVTKVNEISSTVVTQLIDSDDSAHRVFGVGAAKRLYEKYQDKALLEHARASSHQYISELANHILEY